MDTVSAIQSAGLPRHCTFDASDWTILAACWHPVALSRELTHSAPLGVTLLDAPLVLYRSGHAIVVADDRS